MRLIVDRALLAVTVLTLGCSPPVPRGPTLPEGAAANPSAAHDLGIILSRGQTISHAFRLRNPSGRPAKVLGAEALSPCCSEIVGVPADLPAGGEAPLVVRFKPGFQSGPRSVSFRVWTDRAESPVDTFTFTLRANLVAEAEASTIEGRDLLLLSGRTGSQTLRVAFRRLGERGRPAPDSVEAAGSLRARLLGPPSERLLTDGVREVTRDVAVDITAGDRAGSQAGTLTFRWPDGRHWETTVRWTVAAHLSASPEALIVGRDDAVRTVIVRSQTELFRVTGVEGAGVRPSSVATARDGLAGSHVVRFAFDPDRIPASGPFDVTIRTDHPDQPEVAVSVLVASSEPGGDS